MNKVIIFCIGLLLNFTVAAMRQDTLPTSLNKLHNSLINLKQTLNPSPPPLCGQDKIAFDKLLNKSENLIEELLSQKECFLRLLSFNNIHYNIHKLVYLLENIIENPIFSTIQLLKKYKNRISQKQTDTIYTILTILEENITHLEKEIADKLLKNQEWKNFYIINSNDSLYNRFEKLLITQFNQKMLEIHELIMDEKEDWIQQPATTGQSNLDRNFIQDYKKAQRSLTHVKNQIQTFIDNLNTFEALANDNQAYQNDFKKISDSFANIQIINFISPQGAVETPLAIAIKKLGSYKNQGNQNINNKMKDLFIELENLIQQLSKKITDTAKAPWQKTPLRGDPRKLPLSQMYEITFSDPFNDDLKEVNEFIKEQKQLWNL